MPAVSSITGGCWAAAGRLTNIAAASRAARLSNAVFMILPGLCETPDYKAKKAGKLPCLSVLQTRFARKLFLFVFLRGIGLRRAFDFGLAVGLFLFLAH